MDEVVGTGTRTSTGSEALPPLPGTPQDYDAQFQRAFDKLNSLKSDIDKATIDLKETKTDVEKSASDLKDTKTIVVVGFVVLLVMVATMILMVLFQYMDAFEKDFSLRLEPRADVQAAGRR
ncbi:MAG: hypothetical protein JWO36_1922 [Myxococcales bacterium]|nr:hypothetical protein [Myxococcales bacterium]